MRTPSLIAKLIAAALAVFSLAGCGKDEAPPKTGQETKSAQTLSASAPKADRLAYAVRAQSYPVEMIDAGGNLTEVPRNFTTNNEWLALRTQAEDIVAGQGMALSAVYQFGSPEQVSAVDDVVGFTVPETMREALSPPAKTGKDKLIRLVDADYAAGQIRVLAILRGSLDGLFRDHKRAFQNYCNGFADTKPGVCLRFDGSRAPVPGMVMSAVPH
jgi:hypothetical protein